MRLAILVDIHGNLPAFEAALRHVRQQGVDSLMVAGDIVIGSPDSLACWQLAQSLDCTILRGNHERYLFNFDTTPEMHTERFAPVRWAADQFSMEEKQTLAGLPTSLRLPDLLIVHASLRNDQDLIMAHTPEELFDDMFPSVEESLIVRGHNHMGMVRLWGAHKIVTAGSIGLPLDGYPTAQYLIVEQRNNGWSIEHQSVSYNVESTVQRFHSTGYLDATGPMGRLFMREVATASHYLVPFLHAYERWSSQETLTLSVAVERFLSSF